MKLPYPVTQLQAAAFDNAGQTYVDEATQPYDCTFVGFHLDSEAIHTIARVDCTGDGMRHISGEERFAAEQELAAALIRGLQGDAHVAALRAALELGEQYTEQALASATPGTYAAHIAIDLAQIDAALAATPAVPTWPDPQPMSTAPRDGTEILVQLNRGNKRCAIVSSDGGMWRIDSPVNCSPFRDDWFTGWWPLPPASAVPSRVAEAVRLLEALESTEGLQITVTDLQDGKYGKRTLTRMVLPDSFRVRDRDDKLICETPDLPAALDALTEAATPPVAGEAE